MRPSRVELAARNNASWCDVICRLHGTAGEFSASTWVNRNHSPVYYPNLVTLRDDLDQTAVLKTINELIDQPLRGNWGVKDSFQNLALAPLGFDVLFTASWVWHIFSPAPRTQPAAETRWARVVSADELSRWEAVWSHANNHVASDGQSRMFPAALLANRDVAVLAGYRGQHLVAGGIANISESVVGLSNIFSPPNEERTAWTGLKALAQATFPSRPIVGYEHGQSLQTAIACGFEEIGPLRVWLRRT